MPTQTPPDDVQREMVRLYVQEYLTLQQIAERFHWSTTAVRNAIIRSGNRLRPRHYWNFRHRQLPQHEVARTVALYESGLSIAEVAEKVGRSYEATRARLHNAGVPLRPRGANLRYGPDR